MRLSLRLQIDLHIYLKNSLVEFRAESKPSVRAKLKNKSKKTTVLKQSQGNN